MSDPIVIKKYSNRRLYDTQDSRYITLDELAVKVRSGTDVRVVDAKAGTDLTQGTLTQIIMESRGAAKLLPVNLLTQLIRMEDEHLAEFLSRYMAGALELYQTARHGAQHLTPWFPQANVPFAATNAFARMAVGLWNRANPMAWGNAPQQGMGGPVPPSTDHEARGDIDDLRKELEELKSLLKNK